MSTKKAIKENAIYNKIKVISSKEAWDLSNKDSPKLKDCYEFVGKVEKEQPHIIRNTYKNAKKADSTISYYDDFCHLNKCTKKEIIDKLYKSNRTKKVYLVLDNGKTNKNKKKK